MPLSSLLCGLTLLLLLPFITHAAESDSGGVDGGGEVDASSSSSSLPAICSQSPLPRIVYPHRHPSLGSSPPKTIPPHLLPYYTRCGAVGVASMYVDDSWSGAGSHYKFAQPDVERYLKRARALHAQPHTTAAKLLPFVQALQAARAWLQPHSTALVLGSQEPWYETLLLAWGASRVVTLEYNNLTYAHPLLQTVTPAQFLSSEAGGDYFGPRTFDLVVAVAAVDHDGLGRYGDPLAPDGDLLTMDWMRSLLKSKEQRQQEAQAGEASGGVAGASGVDEGGVLILTAPIGPDLVVWNLERRYGRVRLPLLLEGWRQLHRFGYAEERLDLQENFRKRIEPAWILAPNAHTERTTSHSADGLHHADRSSGEAPHDELR